MPGARIPPLLCARCKGYKRLCGLPSCPILSRFRAQVATLSRLRDGREVEGYTPPSLVVGEEGYPNIPVIFQVPPGERSDSARLYDDPVHWFRRRTNLDRILELRSKLVGGIERLDATNPWVLYDKEIGLAAVSLKPVDSEVRLARPPVPRLVFDGLTAPRGPSAPAREIRVAGNPSLHPKLEKLIFDDALAEDALWEAYRAGVDYYTLIRAFSAGFLGRLRNRRLVPTRWAITAVDSIISRRLRSRVAVEGREPDRVELYKGYYLGNRFLILVAPGPMRIEMIELWHPLTPWVPRGSSTVAIRVWEKPDGSPSVMDGGFMAARIAVLEALAEKRIKGYVLVIREILPEYYAPVGNWHIRETVRSTLCSKPLGVFEEAADALKELVKHVEAKEALRPKLGFVEKIFSQKRLDAWLKR